jgi:hypothetical protein
MLVGLPFHDLDVRLSLQLVDNLLQCPCDGWMRFYDTIIPENANFQLLTFEEFFLFPRKWEQSWFFIPRFRVNDRFDE